MARISHALKNLTRRALFRSQSFAARALPPRSLDLYLSTLGAADYYFGREIRARCRPLLADYLNLAPGSPPYELCVSQLCRNLVRWSVPSRNAYWRDRLTRHEWVGETHVRRCLDDGRGVIILLSHFGPWPSAFHEFEQRGLRMELTYPLGWPHSPRFDIPARMEFLRRARRVLAQNGIVALMGDVGVIGVGGLGKMTELPFLGAKTPFPLGGVRLAALTSSPIVPIFSLRHTDGRHVMVCTEPIEPRQFEGSASEQAVQMLSCYAARLEQMVKAHPHNATNYLEFPQRAGAA
jgi:lauroyl/myristoyl acyltransferase